MSTPRAVPVSALLPTLVRRLLPGPLPRVMGALLPALMSVLLLVPVGAPAHAHEGRPGVRAVVDRVEPAVEGVTVRVQASVVPELVVRNSTGTWLTVLDDGGEAFLRISSDGVEADLRTSAWYAANDPSGAGTDVPEDAPSGWTRVSDQDSWAWFDHRLHPDAAAIPGTGRAAEPAGEREDLGSWSIPLRFGDTPVRIEGHLTAFAQRGEVQARLVDDGSLPQGATLTLIPGRVPGLLVSPGEAREILVVGRFGEPMARITRDGADYNARSPSWHDHARMVPSLDLPPRRADPAAIPAWEPLPGRTVAWLDLRGRYPLDEPPEDLLAPGRAVPLLRWSIPVVVDGERVEVAGETVWRPHDIAGADPAGYAEGLPVVPFLLGAGGTVVAASVWGRRRYGRGTRSTGAAGGSDR